MSQILIVDDDPVSRMLMVKIVEESGYTVHAAEDAKMAQLLLQEHPVSVLVTDLQMPGDSGIELFRQAQAERPCLRGILCSAYVNYDVIADIMDSGLDDCLMKPVVRQTLVASVERSLAIQQHWRQRIAELRALPTATEDLEPRSL